MPEFLKGYGDIQTLHSLNWRRQGSSISITYMFLLDFLGNDFCRPYDSPYFIYHVQLSTIASLSELTVPVPGIAQPYHLLDTEAGNSHW